jgi:hypothetical protein
VSDPQVVSRDEWLVARKELLAKEKEFTRARDRLNAERRRPPMVEVDKEYVFDSAAGKGSLLDLFDGRSVACVTPRRCRRRRRRRSLGRRAGAGRGPRPRRRSRRTRPARRAR